MRSLFAILGLLVVIVSVSVSAEKVKCKEVDQATTQKCQTNATYNPCGPNQFCFSTCGGPDGPPCQLEGCNPGCFCNDGFILNLADGRCIRPEDCKFRGGRFGILDDEVALD